MITPSFNLTVTERVLPRLALDFTTASLDSRVTFTRVGATATRVNASGLVELVAADTPRFDYDPVTLACKGLLVEESRTNYQKYSSTFSSWGTYGTAPTLTSITSPTGLNDGTLFEDTGAGYFAKTVNLGNVIANTYTISLYVKQGTAATFGVWLLGSVNSFFFQDSIGWSGGAPLAAGWSSSNAGNGWYRIWRSFTVTSSQTLNTYLLATGSGTAPAGTTGFWGVQVETGAFPTSYIPNDIYGSTTRNADAATMTGTNFSSWYNTLEGTMFAEGVSLDANRGNSCMFQIANGGINSFAVIHASIRYAGSTPTTSRADVTSTLSIFSSIISNNTSIRKIALALKSSNFAACANGSAVTEQLSGELPTEFNQALLGSAIYAPAGQFCGHLRRVAYYRHRLSNAQLQAITA